jgi:peptidyl-prolyl cis-trans isomerase B (cyclophilin B)
MSKKKKNSNYITKNPKTPTQAPKPKVNVLPYVITALVVIAVIAGILLLIINPWKYATPKIGSGGACTYLETRNITDRNVKYVQMDVHDYGSIVILLDATTAPITVNNFIKLVNEGFYDGLTFHRVMEGFMIQGGCPNGNGSGGSNSNIVGEFDENGYANDMPHIKGVISMARSDSPNSASSQFFICNATNDNVTRSLDGKYAAFGYVVAGLDIVDEITEDSLPYTGYNGAISKISDQIVIKKVTVLESYG